MTHSPELRAKMSVAKKGRACPWSKGVPGFFTGKRHSSKTRAKMSASRVAYLVSGRGKKNRTLPELLVAEFLLGFGVEFVAQSRIDGDSRHVWDFVIPSKRLLIEVDGCYWHGCERCGYSGMPTNLAADRSKAEAAKKLGWSLFRIPSCSLKTGHMGDSLCKALTETFSFAAQSKKTIPRGHRG